jgi:hypothetical protein
MQRLWKALASTLVVALILAGCGDDSDDEPADEPEVEEPEVEEPEPEPEPEPEEPEFDAEAASAEVVANLIDLFDQLAIAGNPESAQADIDAALARAAELVEGGDSPEVQAQIPNIAGLAYAAELTVVIDEEPTFSEDNTVANYLFSTLSFGNPSQVDKANGIHVLENGVWKLSSDLWAAFVALGGDATPEDVG